MDKIIETYYNWNRTDKEHLYVNEKENAIDSLETAFLMLNREDNLKWKWVVFALHHSLYSFCVANLELGSYDNVIFKGYEEDDNSYMRKGNEKWKRSNMVKRSDGHGYLIKWTEIEGEPPMIENGNNIKKKRHLIGFWQALARVQDKEFWMARYGEYSRALELNEDEWISIEWLTESFRNRLMHFIPIGIMTKIGSIKKGCKDLIRPIEFLALETGQILYMDNGSEERIKKTINLLEEYLTD